MQPESPSLPQASPCPTGLTDTSVESNEAITQLNRLASIGTLAAGMAHEIKNALVPVRSFVELLLEQHPQAELGEVVQRELRRINSLVSQMLKFAGPAKPVFAPLHLHEALDHSLRLLEFQMAEKQIGLQRAFAAKSDLVLGDSYQLEQAFMNILMNALEAMNGGGKLEIVTESAPAAAPEKPCVRILIRDSGIGIPPENLSRLFETFFTTKPNGTGLGLTISRRIVHEHGGTIDAQSEPNKGTTFAITLPVHEKV